MSAPSLGKPSRGTRLVEFLVAGTDLVADHGGDGGRARNRKQVDAQAVGQCLLLDSLPCIFFG